MATSLTYSKVARIVIGNERVNLVDITGDTAYPVVPAKPTAPVATASTTGGTQAIATYYYKVSSTNAVGESDAAATEVVSTISTSTGSTALSWTTKAGSTGYRVYRGTATNSENVYLTVTATGSYTDIGDAGTAGTPRTTPQTGGYTLAAADYTALADFGAVLGDMVSFESEHNAAGVTVALDRTQGRILFFKGGTENATTNIATVKCRARVAFNLSNYK